MVSGCHFDLGALAEGGTSCDRTGFPMSSVLTVSIEKMQQLLPKYFLGHNMFGTFLHLGLSCAPVELHHHTFSASEMLSLLEFRVGSQTSLLEAWVRLEAQQKPGVLNSPSLLDFQMLAGDLKMFWSPSTQLEHWVHGDPFHLSPSSTGLHGEGAGKAP